VITDLPRSSSEKRKWPPGQNVPLQIVQVRGPDEFESAFANMVRARAGAVIIQNTFLFSSRHIRRLADLAIKHHLPAMYPTLAASSPMGQIWPTCRAVPPPTWTRS